MAAYRDAQAQNVGEHMTEIACSLIQVRRRGKGEEGREWPPEEGRGEKRESWSGRAGAPRVPSTCARARGCLFPRARVRMNWLVDASLHQTHGLARCPLN
eukprot:6176146-Pleurochrysis_carterae.AAC.1